MSPAINGSSALQHFKCSNVIEIHKGMMFDFYPGLPHIRPSLERVPTLYCWSNFQKVKDYLNEHPLWSKLHVASGVFSWSLRSTTTRAMHIKVHVIFYQRLLHIRRFWTDRCSYCGVHASYTTLMVLFRVLCAVISWLWSHWWLFVHYCLSSYLLCGHWVTVNLTWVLFRGQYI